MRYIGLLNLNHLYMKTFKVRQLALIFSLLFIACQEDSIIESDELDQDMLAASELADEYLKSEKTST